MTVLIDFLGLISTAPATPAAGDMVRRSVAGGWETINPGTAGQMLIIDFITGLPSWDNTSVTSLPTASAAYQGCVLTLAGDSSHADQLFVCLKSATNTWSWKLLATG